MIRPANTSDAETISGIYNYYIANTIVTFEEDAVTSHDMCERIREITAEGLPWLVAVDHGEILGYAYASKWKGRCAYRYSVEITVYLAQEATSQGWGARLYEALLSALEEKNMHSVIGGIALPNPASVSLHEKFGLQKVAHFEEVGFKFNRWIDVGYWQKKLNAG